MDQNDILSVHELSSSVLVLNNERDRLLSSMEEMEKRLEEIDRQRGQVVSKMKALAGVDEDPVKVLVYPDTVIYRSPGTFSAHLAVRKDGEWVKSCHIRNSSPGELHRLSAVDSNKISLCSFCLKNPSLQQHIPRVLDQLLLPRTVTFFEPYPPPKARGRYPTSARLEGGRAPHIHDLVCPVKAISEKSGDDITQWVSRTVFRVVNLLQRYRYYTYKPTTPQDVLMTPFITLPKGYEPCLPSS